MKPIKKSSALSFYAKHRFDYSKVKMLLDYLDYLSLQPLTHDLINEFEDTLNELTSKFDNLIFINSNQL